MKKIFTSLFLIMCFFGIANAQNNLSILLVNDDSQYPENISYIQDAITTSGYNYTEFDATTNSAPSSEILNAYELIVWVTGANGTTSLWNETDPDKITVNDDLLTYLDNGGMLWLGGADFMYDAFGSAPDTFKTGDFCYDYLGIEEYAGQSHIDDKVVYDGLPMMLPVDNNGICTIDSVTWRWSTMYYADAIAPAETATPVYQMGPSDYDLADYYCAIYNEKGDAKILSFFTRFDGYKTSAMGAAVAKEVLDYFNQFSTGESVNSTSVEITSESGFSITENDGTLQLSATVLPENASNKTVTWSIGEGSVSATISQTGLLTASGLSNGNGTVYVIATTNDGTELSDQVEVTISGQTLGEGYKVLLVNDNANGTDRYLVVEEAIEEAGYTYRTFNTVTEGRFPEYEYLANFNFVVWYTGNDGVGLYFWDITDENNPTCNSALKQYADKGGVVWVQGLDFLYDVYGSSYSAKNSAGDSIIIGFNANDFAYDYLGIKDYVAQSHSNEISGAYVGVEQLDLTEENEITTLNPIKWAYSEMWYVDALEVTENAIPLYYLGPETYDFALYYAMVYNVYGDAHFITSTFETARLNDQTNTNALFKEVIDYFANQDIGFPTSIENLSISKRDFFKAYPNPVSSKTYINLNLIKSQYVEISLFDISGKKIKTKNTFIMNGNQMQTFDVSSINNGIYVIQIKTEEESVSQRIIVNH